VAVIVALVHDACYDTSIDLTSASYDPDGAVVGWTWNLGDGSFATGPFVNHKYAAGTYTVTLMVTDDSGMTAGTFTTVVSVGPQNCCPVMQSSINRIVREGDIVAFTFYATDFEGDALTYSSTDLPKTSTLDSLTGEFRWTTVAGDAGTYFFHATVSDAKCAAEGVARIIVRHATDNTPAADADLDGIADSADNCPAVPNHDQPDADADGIGDACDTVNQPVTKRVPGHSSSMAFFDADLDSVADAADNCPNVANRDQADQDKDGVGDACDADLDGDGVVQTGAPGTFLDNCPLVNNALQTDSNNDGVGDACAHDEAPATALPATENVPKSCASCAEPASGLNSIGVGAVAFLGVLAVSIPAAFAWARRRK